MLLSGFLFQIGLLFVFFAQFEIRKILLSHFTSNDTMEVALTNLSCLIQNNLDHFFFVIKFTQEITQPKSDEK